MNKILKSVWELYLELDEKIEYLYDGNLFIPEKNKEDFNKLKNQKLAVLDEFTKLTDTP